VASSTIKSDLLAGLAAMDVKTVTRLVIDLQFHAPVTNSLADRTNMVHVGIGVVSQEAFDLETLPDMDTVADYPQQGWVYIASKVVVKQAEAGILSTAVTVFEADIHSQRKVDRGVLFLSILNIGLNGTDNVTVNGRVRALCLT